MANASLLGVPVGARPIKLDLLGVPDVPGVLAPFRLPRAASRSAATDHPSSESPSVTASGKVHDPIWDER
jgi:hypothetical protein